MPVITNPYRYAVGGGPTFGNASRSLDGVDDRISISNLPTGSGDYSLSAWIKVSNFGPIDGIISGIATTNAADWGPALRFDEVSPYNKFAFFAGGSVGPAGILYSSTISSGVWVHVVATSDIGQSAKIYIDGAEDVTGSNPTSFTNHNGNWWIGTDYDGSIGRYFDGLIADVRIYNKALTSSEVSDIYNGIHVSDSLIGWWLTDTDDVLDYSGNGNHGTNNGSTYSIIGPKDYLELSLDAGEPASYSGTGLTWSDLSDYGNDGTLVNGVSYDSNGGGSLVFDGSNDYVTVPPIEPKYFTLSVVFKATGVPSTNDHAGGFLISGNPQLYSGALPYAIGYSWTKQRLNAWVNANGNFLNTGDNSVDRNRTYEATFTYDGEFRKLYINGVLAVSGSWTTDPVYPTSGDRNVQIGRWGYAGYGRHFNGNIYNVQVHNRALTSAEIAENFNINRDKYNIPTFTPTDIAGCVSWLDSSDSSTLYDSTTDGSLVADDGRIARWEDKSGNSNHVIQSTESSRPYRRVAEINSLDVIDFGDASTYLNFTTRVAGAATETIFAVIYYSDAKSGYQGILTTTSSMMLARNPTNWGTYPGTSSNTLLSTGNKYVLCMREDIGSQAGTYFTNGVADGSYNNSVIQNVGVGGGLASQAYGGYIMEIIVYDSALSDSDREAVETYLGAKWGVTIAH